MADIWLPGFEKHYFGPSVHGGPYDEHAHPKLGWHTWEGKSWTAAESAFSPYPPHMAVNPYDRVKHQYVPLNMHSYAFKGNDNDDSFVIQVEVAGFAHETPSWSQDFLRWLGEEVARPIMETVGVPAIIVPQGFHGDGEGIILASTSSPIRFKSVAAMDAFSGHLGHQHMPAPDVHWDPGALDVAAIIRYAQENDDMPITDDEVKKIAAEVVKEIKPLLDGAQTYRDRAYNSLRGWLAAIGSKQGITAAEATKFDRSNK